MKIKDWIILILSTASATAITFFARWLYKKIKSGKWDKWLEKQEKRDILSILEELLPEKDKI